MSLIPGTGAGQKLSPTQIYQLAVQAGFSGADAVTATAIALAESGGQTNIRSDIVIDGAPTYAAGLWQLYTGSSTSQTLAYQQSMSDPLSNARAAYAKFVGSQKAGATGWCPWASYDEGTCAGQKNRANTWRTYLGMAQAAATGTDISTGGGSLVVPAGPDPGGGDNVMGSTATTVAAGQGAGSGEQLTLADMGALGKLQVPSGLLWSLLFIGGAIALVSAGVYLVFRQQINAAAGRAAEVAAIAA